MLSTPFLVYRNINKKCLAFILKDRYNELKRLEKYIKGGMK